VRQREPAFSHHLDEIAKAEFVSQIPADTEDNDLPIEVAPLKSSSTLNRQVSFTKSYAAAIYARLLIFAPEPEASLKTQGKWLNPVLLELGWRRKRIWSSSGPYYRIWVPPALSD
jgi:hypothetical protein